MSQGRGFTRGFVAIERFLILMIYSKKIGTKRMCRNSEVVAIQRCRNWEVPLYIISLSLQQTQTFIFLFYSERGLTTQTVLASPSR